MNKTTSAGLATSSINRPDSPCRKKLNFLEPKKAAKIFIIDSPSCQGKRKFNESCLDASNSNMIWHMPACNKKSKTLIEC